MIDDVIISKAILKRGYGELLDVVERDVVIAGAGPSGLTSSYYLAKAGISVVVFERALKVGGGMPGGGIGLPVIVIQEEGLEIVKEFGISYEKSVEEGYYTSDSLESISKLTSGAIDAGVKILNLTTVEDVMVQDNKINGVVINRTPILMASLHVDPISVRAKYVIDATGHDADVVRALKKRKNIKLNTPSGGIEGEGPMWAEVGEKSILENTKEVFPNLYVTGMAANAVYGAPRMGPIFGGMLLSGKKVAQLIKERL